MSKFPLCLSAIRVTPTPSFPLLSPLSSGLSFWATLPPTEGTAINARRSLRCTDMFRMIWNHFTPTLILCLFEFPPAVPSCLCFFCNAFLVPKFCHCKELSTMPIMIMIMIIVNYELLYLQSLYEQSILSMFHVRPSERSQFSLCISCCLRFKTKKKKTIARFLQKCLFCTRTRGFVVLCITVALLLWIKHVANVRKRTAELLSGKDRPHPSVSWGQLHKRASVGQKTSAWAVG